MLAIARWMMRGTPYAAGGAALSTLIPWLFWLGAAIAALVTLRRGLSSALPVIVAAGIPAGWWWAQGDVIPLSSVLLVTLMAVVLRARMRWSESLIDRKSTRLNSSHVRISYAVFCLKKKKTTRAQTFCCR